MKSQSILSLNMSKKLNFQIIWKYWNFHAFWFCVCEHQNCGEYMPFCSVTIIQLSFVNWNDNLRWAVVLMMAFQLKPSLNFEIISTVLLGPNREKDAIKRKTRRKDCRAVPINLQSNETQSNTTSKPLKQRKFSITFVVF